MRPTRRAVLASGGIAALSLASNFGRASGRADDRREGSLGFVIHSFPIHVAADKGFADPARFLDESRKRGARSIQVDLGPLSPEAAETLRDHAEAAGMTVEASLSPPRNEGDLDRFKADIETARRAGVRVARTVMMRGRRYEILDSADGFRRFTAEAFQSLALAAKVVEREEIRLAVENHKDMRAPELVALLRRVGSDRIGVCLDTGNSLALLEDPAETVEALAPLAFSCHLKDMAVEPYADGFLLSEVPLGAGVLDLPRIVDSIRKANPEIRFQLEMITRDPLKIPCLADRYWATFPELSGVHLARMLRYVRDKKSETPLPRISGLSPADRIKVEDDNIRRSVDYADATLAIGG